MAEQNYAGRCCGDCEHAKITGDTRNDLRQRACFEGPPQPVALPGGRPGEIQIRAFHPAVAINDPACSRFKPKQAAVILSEDPLVNLPKDAAGRA